MSVISRFPAIDTDPVNWWVSSQSSPNLDEPDANNIDFDTTPIINSVACIVPVTCILPVCCQEPVENMFVIFGGNVIDDVVNKRVVFDWEGWLACELANAFRSVPKKGTL